MLLYSQHIYSVCILLYIVFLLSSSAGLFVGMTALLSLRTKRHAVATRCKFVTPLLASKKAKKEINARSRGTYALFRHKPQLQLPQPQRAAAHPTSHFNYRSSSGLFSVASFCLHRLYKRCEPRSWSNSSLTDFDLPMSPNSPHSPPRHANSLAMYQSTPLKFKASGYKAQKIETAGFQENRKAMCKEMTGFWVGPCEVDKFFELTMPIAADTQEALPDIRTDFFSGLKPSKEKDLYPRLVSYSRCV